MFKRFWNNKRGNYALATAGAMVPLMGALALGVDYSEITRQRQAAINATDAAAVATARRLIEGASEPELNTYARVFFDANLSHVDSDLTRLTLILPKNNAGGGSLKLTADLKYKPVFLDTLQKMVGAPDTDPDFSVTTEVQLKNTMEIALVLDNSGSMDELGKGSGKKRMELMKTAAKEMVDLLSAQSQMLQQVSKPVQISLVPFAATVNVGSSNKTAGWMDTEGTSPVHHENTWWDGIRYRKGDSYKVEQRANGAWYGTGGGWAGFSLLNKPLTRFALYDALKKSNGTSVAGWGGCVEARPYPDNVNDTTPSANKPETLFVPTFAPDEPGDRWSLRNAEPKDNPYNAANSWWDDGGETENVYTRQLNPMKYFFSKLPTSSSWAISANDGPNDSCTTKPITPMVDVSKTGGVTAIKTAIDQMSPLGATNVTEGMAWGWRTVSSAEPFAGGRSETEKGNDKIVIVLTDGANTYYKPDSLNYADPGLNKSTYGAYGYVENIWRPYNSRITAGTTVSKTAYDNTSYGNAMNQHFDQLCANAKDSNVMVITVALDLDAKNAAEKKMIDALSACSSDSRIRKGEKLFWNATGKSLSDDFKAIADELSNLRITS